MIADKQASFSDGQALSASAASTNRLDMGAAVRLGGGADRPLYLYIKAANTGGTTPTLAIILRGDTDSTAGSEVTLLEVRDAAALTSTEYFAIPIPVLPKYRYYDLYYTLGGTSPTYTASAWLSFDVPTSDELTYETII